jgi:hypothetical protein
MTTLQMTMFQCVDATTQVPLNGATYQESHAQKQADAHIKKGRAAIVIRVEP